MNELDFELLLVFIGILAVIASIAFFSGKKIGSFIEKESFASDQKRMQRELMLSEHHRKGLQREVEDLKQKAEKYLDFLIKLPEAVKHLNSNLTFDEIISSILRLTKNLVDTDAVELYIFNKSSEKLDLVAAFGSNKKKSISVDLGEGVIGEAAASKLITSKEQIHKPLPDENLELSIPIIYKNTLLGVIGVLGIGKIKAASQTGNEKRFLAMISDLAAVALQNCDYLTTAKKEAITDSLTGLYNKHFFLERAAEIAQKSLSYNSVLSVLIFDIDYFKNYNDQNGHVEGDKLLKQLGVILKENTRGTDIVARYGGEEFIALLSNTGKINAMLYAEKLRKIIESYPFAHREKQFSGFISISGGIAEFPSDGKTIEAIITKADQALYESKKAGRNRITKYEPFQFSSPENAD
ncbi:MAG: GGDEF domain-containing protein [Nitrospiraceae bacterium]|nr:GGDEF domain-containing protein [Nitrospiraceae bacterium]